MNRRLEQFLAAENITQAAFADKINVARASISHILSGRNKPGYEFFASLIKNYPSLNIEWLITGKGKMYKTADPARETAGTTDTVFSHRYENGLFDGETADIQELPQHETPMPPINADTGRDTVRDDTERAADSLENRFVRSQRKAVKVIVFYDDGTFEELGRQNEAAMLSALQK